MKKILIIDDDKTDIELAQMTLKQLGVDVTVCDVEESIIRSVESDDFDIVIIDERLGDLEGHELAKKILDKYKHLKVYVMSNYELEVIKEKCSGIPVSGFISKYDMKHNLEKIINE